MDIFAALQGAGKAAAALSSGISKAALVSYHFTKDFSASLAEEHARVQQKHLEKKMEEALDNDIIDILNQVKEFEELAETSVASSVVEVVEKATDDQEKFSRSLLSARLQYEKKIASQHQDHDPSPVNGKLEDSEDLPPVELCTEMKDPDTNPLIADESDAVLPTLDMATEEDADVVEASIAEASVAEEQPNKPSVMLGDSPEELIARTARLRQEAKERLTQQLSSAQITHSTNTEVKDTTSVNDNVEFRRSLLKSQLDMEARLRKERAHESHLKMEEISMRGLLSERLKLESVEKSPARGARNEVQSINNIGGNAGAARVENSLFQNMNMVKTLKADKVRREQKQKMAGQWTAPIKNSSSANLGSPNMNIKRRANIRSGMTLFSVNKALNSIESEVKDTSQTEAGLYFSVNRALESIEPPILGVEGNEKKPIGREHEIRAERADNEQGRRLLLSARLGFEKLEREAAKLFREEQAELERERVAAEKEIFARALLSTRLKLQIKERTEALARIRELLEKAENDKRERELATKHELFRRELLSTRLKLSAVERAAVERRQIEIEERLRYERAQEILRAAHEAQRQRRREIEVDKVQRLLLIQQLHYGRMESERRMLEAQSVQESQAPNDSGVKEIGSGPYTLSARRQMLESKQNMASKTATNETDLPSPATEIRDSKVDKKEAELEAERNARALELLKAESDKVQREEKIRQRRGVLRQRTHPLTGTKNDKYGEDSWRIHTNQQSGDGLFIMGGGTQTGNRRY